MGKFKIGDRVMRTKGEFLNVRGGCEYTVDHSYESALTLVGHNGSYDSELFTLVEPLLERKQPPAVPAPVAGESDPSGLSANTPGAKLDAGKLQPELIYEGMARALEAVTKVGTAGAIKYTAGGWLEVPNGFTRYSNAQRRHETKRYKGEVTDKDSGSLHLAHEAWNSLAKLELYLREQEKSA